MKKYKSEKINGYWIVSDQTYAEFEFLQQKAIEEKHWESVSPHGVDYYITFVLDSVPYVHYTAKKFNDNSFIFSTMFGNPDQRIKPIENLRLKNMVFGDSINLFFDRKIDNIELGVIGRYVSKPKLWTIPRVKDWYFIPDRYYLTSQPRYLQRSWKNICYRGNLDLLNLESMNLKKYHCVYGDYFYRNPLPPVINQINSNPGKVLVIDDVDGQIALTLSQRFYQFNSFSVDIYCKDVYNSSKLLSSNMLKTQQANLIKSPYKDRIRQVQSLEDVYDTVIVWCGCQDNWTDHFKIDRSDYSHYCKKDGIYIDVR